MAGERFYFNPSGKGLEVFLGPTESKLMELAWEKKSLTVKTALFYLPEKEKPAYTTVMTVLSRLADKGFLTRHKQGRVFVYEPAQNRKEFLKERLDTANKALKQFK